MQNHAKQEEGTIPKLNLDEFIFTPPGPMGLGLEQFMQEANAGVAEETFSTADHTAGIGSIKELPARRIDVFTVQSVNDETEQEETTISEKQMEQLQTEQEETTISEEQMEQLQTKQEETTISEEQMEQLQTEQEELQRKLETEEPIFEEAVLKEHKSKTSHLHRKLMQQSLAVFVEGVGLVPLKSLKKRKKSR